MKNRPGAAFKLQRKSRNHQPAPLTKTVLLIPMLGIFYHFKTKAVNSLKILSVFSRLVKKTKTPLRGVKAVQDVQDVWNNTLFS